MKKRKYFLVVFLIIGTSFTSYAQISRDTVLYDTGANHFVYNGVWYKWKPSKGLISFSKNDSLLTQ
ncbi:MAG: hypothetical protein LBV39_06250, partial [Bacteroidales bacterium]|nr:hypothetical protein [Bacteroidales bacterium]